MTSLLIVIPTYKRCDLLDRTLQSLAECRLPPNLVKVIVAENGIKSGADLVVKKYADQLPLAYQFTEKPNKSNALNEILRSTSNEFIVFFDDDVRIHPDTLLNYSKEVGDRTNGFFLCGRVRVDYEDKPPDWLFGYFPPSVKGWHFHDEKCKMEVPDGLGANWGAFAIDMKETGGFDERKGPGLESIGEDTNMMERLLKRNIDAYYLPNCEVWHFVTKSRCSPEWLLSRTLQKHVYMGLRIAQSNFTLCAKRVFNSKIKLLGIRILLGLFEKRFDARRRFYYEFRKSSHSGILKGVKIARFLKHQPMNCQHSEAS
jgi:glycosyltransferase involved in cell wall biosynthesis